MTVLGIICLALAAICVGSVLFLRAECRWAKTAEKKGVLNSSSKERFAFIIITNGGGYEVRKNATRKLLIGAFVFIGVGTICLI